MFYFYKFAKYLDQTFWIGLNQLTVANGFVWSDGTPVNFVNWNGGEPNNVNGGENCVEMFGSLSIFSISLFIVFKLLFVIFFLRKRFLERYFK